MNIAFLIYTPGITGGNVVIFEHALRLVEYGHSLTMITVNKLSEDKQELFWYKKAQSLEWITYEEANTLKIKFDIVIAGWWETFFELHKINSSHYAYFVQSIESRFYHSNDKAKRKLVESTYTFDIPIITEATWIKKYLFDKYYENAYLVRNGIRKDIYKLDGEAVAPRDPKKLRILVEGPLEIAFKNVQKTIKLCKESLADEIWLLTSTMVDKVSGVDRVFSRIPSEKTAEIYRSCEVIIKLSYIEGMFGPPLEMFHCGGTAIVFDVTGHDEYIIHEKNGLVVKTDDDLQVIKYINELKENPKKLDFLKQNAIETAKNWNSWDISAKEFEKALLDITKKECYIQEKLKLKSEFLYDWYTISNIQVNKNSFILKLKDYIKKNFPYLLNCIKRIFNNIKY